MTLPLTGRALAGRALADPALGSAPGWPLVLYFHHVHPAVRHYTALSPDQFRRGLDIVLDRVGPAIEPAAARPGFRPPGHPCLLITFDDGYRDTLTLAAPVLAEFDVRVLLFCVTGELDRAGSLPAAERAARPPRQSYLTWAEAGQLEAAGHVVSAHTHSHPKLTDLDEVSARREVDRSLRAVTEHTGRPAQTFAYPYGLIPSGRPMPPSVLGFGTVKTAPAPWSLNPHQIRRSYLPSHEVDRWPALATEWRRQWYESR